MKLRTMILAIPIAYLVGTAGWQQLNGDGEAASTSAVGAFSPEAVTSGGTVAPLQATEPSTLAVELSQVRVTTPEEVREVLRITRTASSEDLSGLREAALSAEDALVAGNAALALGRLKAFCANVDLLGLVSDPRLRVRQDAVKACGLDGDNAALPYLEQALLEGDDTIRPLVLEALGRIGGREALALVQTVADDTTATKTERVFARAALRMMKT